MKLLFPYTEVTYGPV